MTSGWDEERGQLSSVTYIFVGSVGMMTGYAQPAMIGCLQEVVANGW